MCGIVGIYHYGTGKQVDPDNLQLMNQQIEHRGPDDSGHAVFGSFGMAMRRLSVIDLSAGHQPMSNEDESVWVVLNGEIYDFQALRTDLQNLGHRFKTQSDTEVLVHAYEVYGEDFVSRLNGMFAFALWDNRQKKLLLARDRAGIKPLYYFHKNGTLAFASETKALFALPEVSRRVDVQGLNEFLTFEYTLAPRTLMEDVYKLEPGHLLVVKDGRLSKRRFWNPRYENQRISFEDATDRLKQELKAAVKRQMVSDVPLGAFLSGGIDSSILVGLMAELHSKPIKTFSIGFNNASYNELSYARIVADHFRTDHTEWVLEPDPSNFLNDYTRYLDEPNADVSVIPTFLVSQLARKKVTVALAGDGGDELFGGYDTYLADRVARWFQQLVPGITQSTILKIVSSIQPTEKKKGLRNRLIRFCQGLEHPKEIEHYRWMAYLSPSGRNRLYTQALTNKAQIDPYGGLKEKASWAVSWPEGEDRQMVMDQNVYLPEDILAKVDVASMANSLEVRVPYLDNNVIDLALQLPASMKIKGFERKVVLKKAFESLLPKQILKRGKQGFSIPLKNWLRSDLKESLNAVLNENTIRGMGLFEWKEIQRLIAEHTTGVNNHAHLLWSLMVFHLWHKKFFETPTIRHERKNPILLG